MKVFKIRLVLLLLLIASFSLDAQNVTNGFYRWLNRVQLTPSDLMGNPSGAAVVLSEVKQKFEVVGDNGANAIISVLEYDKESTQYGVYNKSSSGAIYYFTVKLTDIINYSERVSRVGTALTIGVINFPFKIRLTKNNSDFSGSFNFGAAAGLKFKHYSYRAWNFSLLTGYSISNIALDSISVETNHKKLNSTNNFTAFSFSGGILLENNRAQVGVFCGADFLNAINQKQFNWKHQGKPWLSIGLGYAIFSTDPPSKDPPSNK